MNHKKIIIRADGNAKIGAGHLMRCLTVAEAIEREADVCFFCADEASAALAGARGFDTVVLHTDYRLMEEELPCFEELLCGGQSLEPQEYRTILVDSYYVTNPYLTMLKKYGRVVLLDDMANTAWNADVIINYNIFADEAMYEALNSPYSSVNCLGGEYVPVRPDFLKRNYQVQKEVRHILITTGGGDSQNIAGRILEEIYKEDICFHVVTGQFNPYYDVLCEYARHHENVKIYHNVSDMAGLMAACDGAVTAGGTTVYELCAVGVPFVCFSYAQNQEKLTEYMGQRQIAGYGGAYHKNPELTLRNIGKLVSELSTDFTLRCRYSEQEKCLIDGRGAERIAKLLTDSEEEISE